MLPDIVQAPLCTAVELKGPFSRKPTVAFVLLMVIVPVNSIEVPATAVICGPLVLVVVLAIMLLLIVVAPNPPPAVIVACAVAALSVIVPEPRALLLPTARVVPAFRLQLPV